MKNFVVSVVVVLFVFIAGLCGSRADYVRAGADSDAFVSASQSAWAELAYLPAVPAGSPAPIVFTDLDECIRNNAGAELLMLGVGAEEWESSAYVPSVFADAVRAGAGRPVPGAVEALSAARARGYRVVVVTACSSDLASANAAWLASHGLAGVELHCVGSSRLKAATFARVAAGSPVAAYCGDQVRDHGSAAGALHVYTCNAFYGDAVSRRF